MNKATIQGVYDEAYRRGILEEPRVWHPETGVTSAWIVDGVLHETIVPPVLVSTLVAIAEDDELVDASDGAWGRQAYERRRDMARAALRSLSHSQPAALSIETPVGSVLTPKGLQEAVSMMEPIADRLAALGFYHGETYVDGVPTMCWLQTDGAGTVWPVDAEVVPVLELVMSLAPERPR